MKNKIIQSLYLKFIIINLHLFNNIHKSMSNIHGIDDRRMGHGGQSNQEPSGMNLFGGLQQQEEQAQMIQHIRIAEENRVLFVSGKRQLKQPRAQNYWDMLTFALCPNFHFLSFTALILLADLIMYIVTLSVPGGLDKGGSSDFLQVSTTTLLNLGANEQVRVYNGQVYRVVSAMFLHVYFMHFFGNFIVTFMFLSRVQHTFGAVRTLCIYIVSGIGGNIFSILVSPGAIKAGASTALFGIIGVILGYVIINWSGLDLVGPQMKCQIFCNALLIIMFTFIFTPASNGSGVDYMGHLGGFLAGLWMTSIGTTIINTKRENILRIVFGSLMVVQLLICFVVFYTQSNPN